MEEYITILLSVLQPWAFQAREFLRKKLIGKEVCFTVEIKTALGREYGMVYLGKGEWTVASKTNTNWSEQHVFLFYFWQA